MVLTEQSLVSFLVMQVAYQMRFFMHFLELQLFTGIFHQTKKNNKNFGQIYFTSITQVQFYVVEQKLIHKLKI